MNKETADSHLRNVNHFIMLLCIYSIGIQLFLATSVFVLEQNKD